MANPFSCKLLHKKASFAVVSDERNGYLFTPAEQAYARSHKNTIEKYSGRFAAKEAGIGDLSGLLDGQLAVVSRDLRSAHRYAFDGTTLKIDVFRGKPTVSFAGQGARDLAAQWALETGDDDG